jgi:hypothetical protein
VSAVLVHGSRRQGTSGGRCARPSGASRWPSRCPVLALHGRRNSRRTKDAYAEWLGETLRQLDEPVDRGPGSHLWAQADRPGPAERRCRFPQSRQAWLSASCSSGANRGLRIRLIDLRLFHVPAFSASLAVYTLGIMVLFGSFLFVYQYLQLVLGLSPLMAGSGLFPPSARSSWARWWRRRS